MEVKSSIKVNARKEAIWSVICDIENADSTISAIEKVEILSKPNEGLLGLKWRETRKMFGKEATEVMWITDYKRFSFYQTRAESHGCVYNSLVSIEEEGDYSYLSMSFNGEALSFGAKCGMMVFGKMMKKSTEKALTEDLKDIKNVVECH